MSYGDKDGGTLYLYEVPPNLRNCQPGEKEAIETFWDKEIEKCHFIISQRETKKEEFSNKKAEEEKAKALAEAAKDVSKEVLDEREQAEEEAYQDLLLKCKVDFDMMTEEEMNAIKAQKKKK